MGIDRHGIRVVGTKQVLRASEAEKLLAVYLADDASPRIRERIKAACRAHAVEVRPVESMQLLGEACGIDVGAACAGVFKNI